jgi:hypothetical protein
MERPLEIFFHNMETSKEIEAEIRRAVDQLDKRGGLIGCRVTIDTPHRQHKTGNIYSVHIVLSVDGSDIAVSHEPHHAKDNYAKHDDPHGSLRRAFRAAERQLAAFKSKQRREAEPYRRRPTTTPVIPAERADAGAHGLQATETDMPPKSKSVRPKTPRKPQFENHAGGAPALASHPFEGGKRLDKASNEEKKRGEMARPKDSGRFGA